MSRTKKSARRGASKRKQENNAPYHDKRAKLKDLIEKDASNSLDNVEAVLTKLMGGMSMEKFSREYFEKKPLLVRANGNNLFEKELFSRAKLLDILHEVKLDFEKDMTICKYIDGERQYYVPDKSETKISKNLASKCFDQGYSCQFYQPQRYVDGLVELNAALESYFGCLAGSSAYLTPPFSQALPPHHDDVDVFIIQTEGRKKWQLHKPLVELAGEHSSDLSLREIDEPFMEFFLEEGDVLYFPRGVIHYALTDENNFSTHVTLSIYQHNTWANFMEVALPRVIRRAFDSDVAFRKGLPIAYLNYMGSQFASSDDATNFLANFKNVLGKFAQYVTLDDLHATADETALDYIANRLPPCHLNTSSNTSPLDQNSVFRFHDRSHVRIVIGKDTGSDEPVATLLYSFRNCRIHHMGFCNCDDTENESQNGSDEGESSLGGNESEDVEIIGPAQVPNEPKSISFPSGAALHLLALYNAYPRYVSVEELETKDTDQVEIRGLLLRLWSEGTLDVIQRNR